MNMILSSVNFNNLISYKSTANITNNQKEINECTARPEVIQENPSERIKDAVYDTVDFTTDFIILDSLLNSGVARGEKVADDILDGAVKNDLGFFDSIGDDIGNFFDNLGNNLSDFSVSISDSLGDIF